MKILCMGALNMDHVYTMQRFIRAGETISALDLQNFCGGKGLNQSIALSRAGCAVRHAGMVGKDGDALLRMLSDNGVDTAFVKTVDAPSGHAIIQVDEHGENCIIIYAGANGRLDEPFIDAVFSHFQAGDIVAMQNETANLAYALRRAHELGLRVAMNPSPITDSLLTCGQLHCADWFILNEIEGSALTGETEPEAICRALRQKYPQAAVMLTMGAEGCLYYDGTQIATQQAFPAKVADTTAAGDTFTGYFLAGVVEGLDIRQTLRLASMAASMAVSAVGAAPSIPMRCDVDRALAELEL